MTGKDIVREFEANEPKLEQELQEALSAEPAQDLEKLYEESTRAFEPGRILEGTVLSVIGDDAVVDVGYKSEGTVRLEEFPDAKAVKPGQKVEVLLEAVEDDSGVIVLSKRRADRIRAWERIVTDNQEGDVVTGRVIRKIKGGLLVDIGVPVFLPASQVSIRRSGDIAEYIGQDVECKIIKIDRDRRNIVVSRRRLLEERREEQKKQLMAVIQVGEIRRGVVKNITDFGAFVDLGGIDGLLHITDMSWGRISHPSEVLAIDDVIEVMVLKVDKEKEKISLGLKQKSPSPWAGIEQRYPVGSRAKGQVVNVMSYGAFVKIEEGVEGLVHISEMSWTRRLGHPSELVAIGDMVEVVVLGINLEKEEISLGMKQTEVNPWALVKDKYPPGTVIKGRVRNLTNYGAFIEIEEGIDGLLHVSDMSWTRKVAHPSEVLKKGEKVEAMVLSVTPEKKRVALGLKQLEDDPWTQQIPEKYNVGDIVSGTVTKLTNFGVFVELEDGLEGLLHISELTDEKVESPEQIVQQGQQVEVKVIRVDVRDRKIGLSLRQMGEAKVTEAPQPAEQQADAVSEAAEGTTEAPEATEPSTQPDSEAEAAAQPEPPQPAAPAVEETAGQAEPEAAIETPAADEPSTQPDSEAEPAAQPEPPQPTAAVEETAEQPEPEAAIETPAADEPGTQPDSEAEPQPPGEETKPEV